MWKITRSARTALACMLLFSGCTSMVPYRTDYTPCVSDAPDTACGQSAIQSYQSKTSTSPDYTLGLIEFDDQGQLFRREQMSAVLNYVAQQESGGDAITVVFVHGWKHNAKVGDDNIQSFREVLLHLSETEQALSRAQHLPARKIIGIYLGWRGLSLTTPVIENLTFWDRKDTAHKVGHGGVTEVLNRLDLIRATRDAEVTGGHSRSRLIVVGHSFGGAVVFSALSQILESRFVESAGAGGDNDAAGFGNLVVLINPAFEALLYAPLSDMANERKQWSASQLPVLAILTSEADDATKVAFPIGRWFSTWFESERQESRINAVTGKIETISEHQADIDTVGHFPMYQTHFLRHSDGSTPSRATPAPAEERAQSVLRSSQNWENDAPGSQIEFPGSVLRRSATSAGRNPYLVIGVDKTLIPDHNDIWGVPIQEFIGHLILISGQSHDFGERMLQRQQALK